MKYPNLKDENGNYEYVECTGTQTVMETLIGIYSKITNKAQDLLKDVLLDYFKEINETETVGKIIKKGIPNSILVYGEATTCQKNNIIFFKTSPLIPKGKLLLEWFELPKLATGGLVFGEWQRKEIETPETGFIRRIEMNIDVKQMIANLGKQNK